MTVMKFRELKALVDEVERVGGRLKAVFAVVHEEIGLTEMELAVLNAITDAPYAPTVPRLGRTLGHARQVIQRAANTLVDRGLIETAENPDHLRAFLLVPTKKGIQARDRADALAEIAAAPLLEDLTIQELNRTVRSLRGLREDIEEAIGILSRATAEARLARLRGKGGG